MANTIEERSTFEAQRHVAEKIKIKTDKVQLHALDISFVSPEQLKPNPYNPNKQSDDEFELLCQSIRVEGFTAPILVNHDMTIIDGEHRWRAATYLGMKRVPIVTLDLDEVRMKMSTIRHNKARGSHDANLEAMVLKDLEQLAGADFIEKQLLIDEDALTEILNFTNAPDMMAGEEFGNSWSPVKGEDNYISDDKGNLVNLPNFAGRLSVDGNLVLRSATEKANQTAYNKVALKDGDAKKKDLYRLTAVYDLEDGDLIKEVLESEAILGQTPAERFLVLVKSYIKEGLNG